MYSLFFDDITWCVEENCEVKTCRRNPVNMIQRSGPHSYTIFKGTECCPDIYKCMRSCPHANKHDITLRELEEIYCDNCAFSSMEED